MTHNPLTAYKIFLIDTIIIDKVTVLLNKYSTFVTFRYMIMPFRRVLSFFSI